MKQKYLDSKDNEEVWSDLWDIVTSHASIWKTSRQLNALPEDASMLSQIMKSGGTSRQDYNRSIREISWLEEHGQCMDNIKVGQSEIPDAGRGAFANRCIPQGGLVAPAPLIHIPDSKVLKMYLPRDGVDGKNNIVRDLEGPVTFQLMMNYCFGHGESTLLLCPYGHLMGFINHSADRPNTKFQWGKEMPHSEWRQRPINTWGEEDHSGLSFDFVALRDIDEDEEILIDYGEAWKRAWQAHVRRFVPRENYIPAYELNEMQVYRTADEPQFEGVLLWCRSHFFDGKKDSECRILKRVGEDRYMAQLIGYKQCKKEGTAVVEVQEILWSVPADAFYFTDLSYWRDHQRFDAFRRPMMIPDELFPDIWKEAI
jgi:hypothetical protein